MVAFATAYVFGLAWLQSRGTEYYRIEDLIVPRLIDVFVFAWLFWVGASIGSFLNVVAWRMPRGMSVNGRSVCPRCRSQLRARDNIPVFGWLALAGRCRHCHLPISPRYPMVEAAVGLSLTLVGIGELYGFSLPYQTELLRAGPLASPVVDRFALMVLVYHAVGLAFCWAYGLIRFDGHRLPPRLIAVAVAWLSVPMLVDPAMMVVSWQTEAPPNWPDSATPLDALMRIVTALAAAGFFARVLARGLSPGADLKTNPLGQGTARLVDLMVILSVPALLIGWQAFPAVLLVAALIAFMLEFVESLHCDALGQLALAMPVATALQIVLWRHLQEIAVWPSEGSHPAVILVAAGLVFCVPLWLREQEPAGG